MWLTNSKLEPILIKVVVNKRTFDITFSSMNTANIRRAKLFTYSESMLDKGTGKKSWNEKGVGDIKILK